ncbi:TatD-related deoxyribonuclease [Paenibacillus curdlanolyticus YK9]|uniref:TatD-related deoxyribonuclease n=1 Tax=Paenibacillus curdlanolyticus YK9 TaxID=717606 RepID=E0I3Y6_9BACL|nr:TatD family hydrolase [Paenibacillus curdlanolyticus]EFM13000.1 TatD-related deoxyribonuclease [Paenibacillus curdlanolyticus YK9]
MKMNQQAKPNWSWMDAHIHWDRYEDEQRERMAAEAREAGCEGLVAVSMHLASSQANHAFALRAPEFVIPAYGFHPEQPAPSDDELMQLIAWIRERHQAGERFAIGEVGLPYYTRTEREAAGHAFDETPYLQMLEQFAALAAELDRTLVLHAVYEDAAKACELLDKHQVRRAHFHWFKGDAETIDRMIRTGRYISITPDVLYEEEIRELVRVYPLELMMAETDGPWPFEGPFQGMATAPVMVADVVREIALLKGVPVAEAASVLLRNTRELYTRR